LGTQCDYREDLRQIFPLNRGLQNYLTDDGMKLDTMQFFASIECLLRLPGPFARPMSGRLKKESRRKDPKGGLTAAPPRNSAAQPNNLR
jgi:hypothetical protein